MANENTLATGKEKERSTLYPACSIDDCLELAREISRIGGKKASIATIASSLGVSVTTNSFKSKVSASKQFGLIKGSGGTVELTEAAKRLVYATDDCQSSLLLIECFLTAPLYRKLSDRYDNQAVPPCEKLANVLLLEYGITKAAKDIAAAKFIESAQQVGALQNGVLVLTPDEDERVIDNSEIIPNAKEIIPIGTPLAEPATSVSIPYDRGYHFEIPTLSGAVAQVTIPKDITVKDLDFIAMYIEKMLPIFFENLKSEIDQE